MAGPQQVEPMHQMTPSKWVDGIIRMHGNGARILHAIFANLNRHHRTIDCLHHRQP
jgi:hypothetical protein